MSTHRHGPGRREFVAMVALVMAVNALAIDIVLPAMLAIGEHFSTIGNNDHQFIITAYLLFFGIGQLLFGTLADVFGRKPVILAGLALYGLAALIAPMAGDFSTLLVLRAVSGLGAAAARVGVIAVVRDAFSGREMAAVMSVVMMVFMAVPIFAPSVGQLIMLFAEWQQVFQVMAVLAIGLIVWVHFRLNETLATDSRKRLNITDTMNAFRLVLSTRRSIGYSLAQSLFFGSLFGFVNTAQQIYVGIYDVGAAFPLYFSAGGLAICFSNLVNANIVRRLGMRRISHSALTAFFIATSVLTLLSLYLPGGLPLWLFVSGLSFSFAALGLIGTNFNAIAMEPLGDVAGTAASVFGFIQIAGSAIIGAIIGQTYAGTTTPVLFGFVICSVVSFAMVYWAERGKLFRERS